MGAIKIIVNPHSRKCFDLDMLTEGLAPKDCSIAIKAYPGHAVELAEQAAAEGFQKVIAVGGDGTVNEILNSLAGRQVPLGIIPAGGANDFATHLGIPVDSARALAVALDGTERSIDLIKVKDRYFATVGGSGFGAGVVLKANKLKSATTWGRALYRLLGSYFYSATALFEIVFRPEFCTPCGLIIEGQRRQVNLWSLFVGNQPRLGKRFLIHPTADNGDSWLDICVMNKVGNKLLQLLTLLYTFKGKHSCLPFVETHRARSVIIDSEEPLVFFGDGEILNMHPPHIIELVPRALTVMVPNYS